MKNWHLNHKKALITGGTKGIGKATVEEFLVLGAAVIFTARNTTEVAQLEHELQQQGFSQAKGIVGDVSDATDRQKIVDWIVLEWGSLDILVNNAGINIRKSSTDYKEEELRKILEINLIAPFELARALFPLLKLSGNASIINNASVAGIMDVRSGSPYGMSKGGLLQLTRSLAREWAEFGIRVNAISPWYTETPLTEPLLSNAEKLETIIDRTPLKRVAQAEEMANAITFLAMDKSSYITGHNLIVDGGLTANAF